MSIRVLIVGGGLVLLACLLGLCLHFFGSGDIGGGPWPGVRTANAIAPRWTSLDQVTARIGPPDRVEPYGRGLERATFRVLAQGTRELTLWLDEDRYVRWARIVPDGPLSVGEVEARLKGFAERPDDESGDLRRYRGGFLRVAGDAVKEIWIVDEAIGLPTLAREM